MNKLYKKNQLWFALLWIILYTAVTIPIRGELGDESVVMLVALALIAVGIFVFVKYNHLEEKYGFGKWKGKAKDYWFFIPLFILTTGNLWGGFKIHYNGISQVFAVVSMLLIGFVEEVIFRGFLFRAILKRRSAPVAIGISAVTFGIGHIFNFFAGQTDIETVMQIFFAVAMGFIFTFVFYKSCCIWICVAVHGLIDVFSKFSAENPTGQYTYIITTIVFAIVYCIYLSKKPNVFENKQ